MMQGSMKDMNTDKRPLVFMLGMIDGIKILGYNVYYLNPD